MGCSRWEVLGDEFLVHCLSLNADSSGEYLMKGGCWQTPSRINAVKNPHFNKIIKNPAASVENHPTRQPLHRFQKKTRAKQACISIW